MSGEAKPPRPKPQTQSSDANSPRSGSGSDTALEALIRKRRLDTNGETGPAPLDDAPGPPAKG